MSKQVVRCDYSHKKTPQTIHHLSNLTLNFPLSFQANVTKHLLNQRCPRSKFDASCLPEVSWTWWSRRIISTREATSILDMMKCRFPPPSVQTDCRGDTHTGWYRAALAERKQGPHQWARLKGDFSSQSKQSLNSVKKQKKNCDQHGDSTPLPTHTGTSAWKQKHWNLVFLFANISRPTTRNIDGTVIYCAYKYWMCFESFLKLIFLRFFRN